MISILSGSYEGNILIHVKSSIRISCYYELLRATEQYKPRAQDWNERAWPRPPNLVFVAGTGWKTCPDSDIAVSVRNTEIRTKKMQKPELMTKGRRHLKEDTKYRVGPENRTVQASTFLKAQLSSLSEIPHLSWSQIFKVSFWNHLGFLLLARF